MKILNILKAWLKKSSHGKNLNQTEDEFYEKLFIENQSWNTITPNSDESKRWRKIESFIHQINRENLHFHILDLGCGRGWLANLLSDYGDIIGVEPVEKVVDYAKKLFPKLNFIKGSTEELLVNNYENKFNLIVSSEVIEHVPRLEKKEFVKDIYKLLKLNSYCIITTPREEVRKEWNKYTPTNQPVEEWISENDLKSIFEENGFERIGLERIPVKPKGKEVLIDVYQICLFKKI